MRRRDTGWPGNRPAGHSRRWHCRLAEEDPSKAELVKLRFFAGLSLPQAAAVLRISPTTADRHWSYARAWLYNELRREE